MLGGIEARHAWTPPGAAEAAAVLGRLTDDEGNPVWPRFRLREIGGLSGGGDPEDVRDPRVGTVGEITRLSQRRGKSVSYQGLIEARSLKELREARDTLVAAFADLTREGRMDVSWHPLNAEFAEEPSKFYEARALTVEVVEQLQGKRWVWPFVVGLRMGDPRYFDEAGEAYEASTTETNEEVPFA